MPRSMRPCAPSIASRPRPATSRSASFTSSRPGRFAPGLVDQTGPSGRPLSAATITTTLKHLRNFFLWLSREPGFRSKLNANDANYFTPSEQDRRIAGARREGPVPTLDEIEQVLDRMPSDGPVEKRNRARHRLYAADRRTGRGLVVIPVEARQRGRRTVFQDGREVKTKRRKTFTSHFFPVGPKPLNIVSDYVAMLTGDLGFGPDDPLFQPPGWRMRRTGALQPPG